jgi:NAD(P)-dependent dehydrogenase (short-subunit alcohol dehydrogenase family)
MKKLEGKKVIITGAGSGIGQASAILFAAEGASVLAVDLNGDGLARTVETITDAGGVAFAVEANIAVENEVEGFVSECMERFGNLDVIYANAGVSGGAMPIPEQTVEHWQQVLEVNLIGPFLAIKHGSVPMIRQGHGSIICTASVAGIRANAGGSAYSASKAGVISLVQTTADQFAGTGVRVNAICPGLIETGMTKPLFDGARQRGSEGRIGQLTPSRRYGEPVEIANMALFLASDDASYVNGQAIAVDGGLSSTHPFVLHRK